MIKSCSNCRHWHEFASRPHVKLGTCRVRAPLRGNGCLDDLGLDDPIDRLAVCLWPSTAGEFLCSKFAWQCQSEMEDCRENAWPRDGYDQQRGTSYCDRHLHEKRRPVAV